MKTPGPKNVAYAIKRCLAPHFGMHHLSVRRKRGPLAPAIAVVIRKKKRNAPKNIMKLISKEDRIERKAVRIIRRARLGIPKESLEITVEWA